MCVSSIRLSLSFLIHETKKFLRHEHAGEMETFQMEIRYVAEPFFTFSPTKLSQGVGRFVSRQAHSVARYRVSQRFYHSSGQNLTFRLFFVSRHQFPVFFILATPNCLVSCPQLLRDETFDWKKSRPRVRSGDWLTKQKSWNLEMRSGGLQ